MSRLFLFHHRVPFEVLRRFRMDTNCMLTRIKWFADCAKFSENVSDQHRRFAHRIQSSGLCSVANSKQRINFGAKRIFKFGFAFFFSSSNEKVSFRWRFYLTFHRTLHQMQSRMSIMESPFGNRKFERERERERYIRGGGGRNLQWKWAKLSTHSYKLNKRTKHIAPVCFVLTKWFQLPDLFTRPPPPPPKKERKFVFFFTFFFFVCMGLCTVHQIHIVDWLQLATKKWSKSRTFTKFIHYSFAWCIHFCCDFLRRKRHK